MSLTSLSYDDCYVQDRDNKSVGPGLYMLNTPHNGSCGLSCLPSNPHIQAQKKHLRPGQFHELYNAVDIDSELIGLTRRAARKCTEETWENKSLPQTLTACDFRIDETRLSNPPSTLRGIEINRFEWQCRNPQDNAEIPFDHNVNNRIIVKDNHRPILPILIDQTPSLPREKPGMCIPVTTTTICSQPIWNHAYPSSSS